MNLLEMRAALAKELVALNKLSVDEDRDLTEVEDARFEEIESEIRAVDKRIKREERASAELVSTQTTGAPSGRADIEVGSDLAAERGFGSFGEQMRAIVLASRGTVDPRLTAINTIATRATGANESIGSEGGFFLQPNLAEEVIKQTHETGMLASRCDSKNAEAMGNSLTINGVDETSRANGSRWGGVQAYWANEAATVTASKPKFRQIDLKLNKLMALYYATDELLEDTTALGEIATEAFTEEMAFKVDDAIMNGDGSGKPLGILNSGALISVSAEAGQAAATVVGKNVIKMRGRLGSQYRANMAWFINQEVEEQLQQMTLPVGTGGVPLYMPANGLSGLPFDTLYGRPVIPIEQCSALGTVGDIVLADMGMYMLLRKRGIEAASSIHVRFIYGENTFRWTMRVDGQPKLNSALTPFKGSTTTSPFVALATRS